MTAGGTIGYTAQLPPLDPTSKLLPPGIHACTLAEFEDVFVVNAPQAQHRAGRFRALLVYIDSLIELFPNSTLWLDGGFVSHKATPPYDIDVLAKVKSRAWHAAMKTIAQEEAAIAAWANGGQVGAPPKTPTLTQFGGLVTLQDVSANGAYFPRIQPFGGRIDSFIFPDNQAKALQAFRRDWMTDMATGANKGFVEVSV